MTNVPEPFSETRRAYAKGRRDAMKEIKQPPFQTESNHKVIRAYWEGWHLATKNMKITKVHVAKLKRKPR